MTNYATLENATAYKNTDDKFIFCLDLMGLSINERGAEQSVNALEDMFDIILAKGENYGTRI